MRRLKHSLILVCGVAIFTGGIAAYAANTTVTSSIKFLSDLTIGTTNGPNFGDVKAATVGTYVLSTAGIVTASGGGIIEGRTPQAGNYTITVSKGGLINIFANNYLAAGGSSTPKLATCTYKGVAVAGPDCTGTGLAPPGASSALVVGLTVTTTAGGLDGVTDHPTFTMNVVYQ